MQFFTSKGEVSGSVPRLQTHTAQERIVTKYTVLHFAGFRKYQRAQIAPLTDPYCIIRFILLISTVLPFAGFRKYRRAQIAPLIDLHCFIRFILLVSTVLPFADFLQVPGSDHLTFRPILPKLLSYFVFYSSPFKRPY